MAIGFLLAQDAISSVGDHWGFAIAVLTSICGGVAGVFGWVKSRETKRVDALAASQEARIAAAERREAETKQERKDERESFIRRLDVAIDAINKMTAANTELTMIVKQFAESFRTLADGHRVSHDELRKINGSIDLFLRETDRRGPYGP